MYCCVDDGADGASVAGALRRNIHTCYTQLRLLAATRAKYTLTLLHVVVGHINARYKLIFTFRYPTQNLRKTA